MRPAPRRFLAVLLTLIAVPAARAQDPAPPQLVAETEARTPAEERAGFHLPEGFVIELVASEPEINKPMNLAFDDRGRLWVTSTLEYPYPVTDGRPPRDRVVILDDFAEDGHARSVSTFADGLNIPIGLLPIGRGDSALVHDIPNIRRFVDTDGDGKADKVEVAYEKYGFRDTHGMTNAFSWGFDGWIYACHGFSNESEVKGADGKPIVMQSGNVYRMRPDGSHAEYYSHGQVNPFGLAFDPMGNLYSCDCHSRPIYQILRGAFYPSFGKPDDGLGFGPEMIGHDHGSTGIGGIAYYAADQFPEAYRGTIFIGNVVTSRINHDQLTWTGSSPKAVEQPDFVVSDDPWFRPVDIELGPDGALYVADFYNRIIGHYEVPLDHPGRDRERGRIWRIRFAGKDGNAPPPRKPRPDESAATIAELVEDLGHANLAIRTVATNQLVSRGTEAIAPIKAAIAGGDSPEREVHGLWALQRLGALDEALLAPAAADPSEIVRVHAMRILADRPTLEGPSRDLVLAGLKDASASVRRAGAEALGRHPSADNIRPLLDLVRSVDPADRHLLHVARIALRDQLMPSASPPVKQAALDPSCDPANEAAAWDKLAGLAITPEDEKILADVAPGVPSAESARFLLAYLTKHPEPIATRTRYARHVARFGGPEAEAGLVAFARTSGVSTLDQVALLEAIQKGMQERGVALGPDARGLAADASKALLSSNVGDEVQAGIELAGSLKLESARDTLAAIAASPEAPAPRRTSAMTAWASIDPAGSIEAFGRMLRDSAEPVEVREQAASLLVATGKPESRTILVEALATAPARLQTAIATGLAQNRPGAEALLEAVAAGKASARPLGERGVSVRLTNSGVPDIQARLESLLKDLPPADRKVQDLIAKRRETFLASGGDASKGVSIFEKNCAACHQLEGKGARVGPQLDGVGVRGVDRLLEDTLDPNRNVDQAFRVTTLALTDGRVESGLLLRQDGEVLVLADAQGKEVRVPSSDVEDRKLSQLSPMPANLAEQIEESDFAHLIAYLLSRRPVEAPPKP
ncbi:PVC-type heme-binding CxxCH protein [Tundrisphaera lichenicola]|uniref:PVC-type heme-binding CxxCH protein n=1 Tax=Tundrisphaera lichenicola TaxID=2029860 RepID=UPI003EBF8474